MNQTKKRLSIINLAISITDIETIQLQILKLRALKADEKIQEIVHTLEEENYAQAQTLITTYIDTPNNVILQRTFQKEKEKREEQNQAVIEEFDLFTVPEKESEEVNVIDLDDMLKMRGIVKQEETAATKEPEVDFDELLNINSKDIMPENINIDISHKDENDFWQTQKEEKESSTVEEDDFFDIPPTQTEEKITQREEPESFDDDFSNITITEKVLLAEEREDKETLIEEEEFPVSHTEEEREFQAETSPNDDETFKEAEEESREEKVNKKDTLANVTYRAIPYIDQKFKNMQVQYPSMFSLEEHYASVDEWLLQISTQGYSDADIVKIIEKINTLKEESPSEAAQLLLISAATESKFAQLILARTLFKGDILEENLPEAFTLINRLAVNDDFPEAICDLAQLYEHGLGIDKDRERAEILYGEAMDLGIKRAEAHYNRLAKEHKGLLSFFRK